MGVNGLIMARLMAAFAILLAVLFPASGLGVAHAAGGQAGAGWTARFDDDDGDDGDEVDDGDDDDDDIVAPPPQPTSSSGPPVEADDDGDDDDDDGPGQRSGRIVDPDGDASTDGYYDAEAIVRLRAGASIDAYNDRHDTKTIAALAGRDVYLLELPAYDDAGRIAERLADDDAAVWAELNYLSQAPEGRPQHFFTSGAPELTGNDEPYALDLLDVETARACATGSGVTIAVLDTGVDATHPMLQGRVLASRGVNLLAGTNDTADAGNGLDDDADGAVDEMTGHGTHIAGIIARVAPGAAILPVTVLNSDGVGDAFYLAAGIDRAVALGADIINLSLSSTFHARVVEEAVGRAIARDVVIAAAAGNADREEPAEYPAAAAGVIGVASTDAEDRKSAFSNFGDAVAISAPGEEIVSALPGGRLAAWGGTSMATAFVSAAAALTRSAGVADTGAEVRERLMATAAEIAAENPDYADKLGAGRLDIGRAGCA